MDQRQLDVLNIHINQAILNTLNNLLLSSVQARVGDGELKEADEALLDYHRGLTYVMNKKIEEAVGPCVSEYEMPGQADEVPLDTTNGTGRAPEEY